MKKIAEKPPGFNSTPQGQAADRREYQDLPYPAKKLVTRFGMHPRDARIRARLIGWSID